MTNQTTHISIAIQRDTLEALAKRERRWYRVASAPRRNPLRGGAKSASHRTALVPCCV